MIFKSVLGRAMTKNINKSMKSPIEINKFDNAYSEFKKGEEVYSLPPECFTSKDFFDFEMSAIWHKDWFCVGHESELRDVGDYYTIQVGPDPLIIIKGRGGEVHALSNVCQHRGMLIVQGRGNTRRLTCPLHSWVYSLEGQLTSAPGVSDKDDENFDVSKVCLPKFKVDTWEGFIFVSFNEDVVSIKERLGSLGDKLKNYKINELKGADPLIFERHEWNWKIFNDECYHCCYLHAESWGTMFPLPPCNVDESVEFNEPEKGIVSYNLIGSHVDAAPTYTGKILQPHIEGLTDEQRSNLTYVTIAPNLLIVAMPDKVKYFMWLPAGPQESYYAVSWMYPESTIARADFRENFDREMKDLWPVMEDDLFAWRSCQTGFNSRFATQGRLTSSEEVIKRLQNWLIDKYRKEDSSAEA